MRKVIPVMAVLAIAAAAPALAQEYRYPSDNSATTATPPESGAMPQSREEWERDQQARTPESSEQEHPGTVETLRNRSMSSPNVEGDAVPDNPATGVPAPEGRGNPKSLESVPRP